MAEQQLEQVLEESFLDYAAFIAQRRVVPDARDCFKYTARQILHAQKREKLDCGHPFKKAQKSVAAATSFSYVHGDTSAYSQIIRMGRPLVQRYAFEEISGNGGTPVSADDYSASRYVECRLSALTDDIMKYMDKDGLLKKDWSPTYDEEGEFPLCFPSVGFYNICNGAFGAIGVGLISGIPQFNLKEVNDAICNLIDNVSYEVNILPDFASKGILLNPKTTLKTLSKGTGKSCLLRSHIKQGKDINGDYVEVVDLPYGVFTETLCKKLGEVLKNEEKNLPFDDFKDLSKSSVQVRVYGKDLLAIEKWLYENTCCQSHFTIEMTMLANGKRPQLFSLKDALLAHIEHIKGVYRRQYEFELNKLKTRQEIIEGLQKAYSIIDEIIALIKASQNRANAILNLKTQKGFSQIQAEAIVDLKLHKLTSIDIQDLKDELDANLKEQERINQVLTQSALFNNELKDIYKKVADKYGDARRTEIYNGEDYEGVANGEQFERNFYISFDNNNNTYYATEDKNDELLNADYKFVELDKTYVAIAKSNKCIAIKGVDIKAGRNNIKDLVKTKEHNEIVYFEDLSQLKDMYKINGLKLDKSIIKNAATARGRKITLINKSIESVEEL